MTETSTDPAENEPSSRSRQFGSTDRTRFAFFGTEDGLEPATIFAVMSAPEMPEGTVERDTSVFAPGSDVEVLFCHAGSEGLSLARARFGPGYMLARHSH